MLRKSVVNSVSDLVITYNNKLKFSLHSGQYLYAKSPSRAKLIFKRLEIRNVRVVLKFFLTCTLECICHNEANTANVTIIRPSLSRETFTKQMSGLHTYQIFSLLYNVSQKTCYCSFRHNFGKCWPIFKQNSFTAGFSMKFAIKLLSCFPPHLRQKTFGNSQFSRFVTLTTLWTVKKSKNVKFSRI